MGWVKRLAALAAAALVVAGCTGASSYFDASDAPDTVANGSVDPRLALTRAVGGPLAPIVRNMAAPYGGLRFANGLEDYLRETLRPFDIVMVRSRPALTRAIFPSYFTHSLVWLGTPEEMRANGGLQVAGKHAKRIQAGKTVFEAAGDEVRLSEIGEILNTDEIAILRPQALGRKRSLGKYRGLLSKVGMPFDYNFDFLDKSRLTCMETVAEIFPEFGVPVRYTAGRYAVIPDDLVRRALAPGSGLTVVAHIQSNAGASYAIRSPSAVAQLLSQPQAKPRLATVY
jgi:hypothetical protein